MLEKFLPRIEFDSYEDLKKNYKVSCPDNFNFAYDIVDGWADLEPEKKHCCTVTITEPVMYILSRI